MQTPAPDRPVTPNRSAGRIEDELWQPFLAKARAEGLTNTDAFRLLIRQWTSLPGAGHRG